jgi:hypothetical protein
VLAVVCAATARTTSALQFKSLVNFDGTNGYYLSGTLVQGLDGIIDTLVSVTTTSGVHTRTINSQDAD